MKLIEVELALTGTPSTVARTGSSQAWDVVANPTRSQTEDGTWQNFTGAGPFAGSTFKTEHLVRMGFTTPAKLLSRRLHSIKVKIVVNGGNETSDDVPPASTEVWADEVMLVKAGAILTSVNAGTTERFLGVVTRTFEFTPASLAALGVTRLDLLGNPTDFGAALGITNDDSVASAAAWSQVDYLGLVLVLQEEDESMDYKHAADSGGWRVLHEEAMPSVVGSTAIFANAPAGTEFIDVRIDTADLVVRFNKRTLSGGSWSSSVAAATTSSGLKYFANERPRFPLNYEQAQLVRAIQSGGTTTGWIVYWGESPL